MTHVLIVEDDVDSAEALAILVEAEGFTVATAGTLHAARRQIALQRPGVLLVDLKLPDGSGMELINASAKMQETAAILITGHASLDTSIRALRQGAIDYIVKPVDPERLRSVLERLAKGRTQVPSAGAFQRDLESVGHFGPLWGRSQAMRAVYQQIERMANTDAAVLIAGESGTGKELVAHTLHALSRRRARPYCAVNCGAISPNLVESEIFGHEKGSFTGADRQHIGFFERAHGGTLFLDEVTEMPSSLQVKLLRVLETGTIMRVGSTEVVATDVRILAATNRDPAQAVTEGKLREDLFYRLNVFPIQLPPLRAHPEDIEPLAQHFLDQICRLEGMPKRFGPQALCQLTKYDWPGNVRELRNIVYRGYVMAKSEIVGEDLLPAPSPKKGTALEIKIGMTLDEVFRQVTRATLTHVGSRHEAAAVLGISLKTMYNRMKAYGAEDASRPQSMPA
jgi:DNA-binding NtrC family response regulator